MCEYQLCFRLMESMDAAFRGTPFEHGDLIGSWGRKVLEAWQHGRIKPEHPRGFIWHIALESLQRMSFECPCEGMAQELLYNPERFLRTVVIIARQYCALQTPDAPRVLH
jgi:hypothetical protein